MEVSFKKLREIAGRATAGPWYVGKAIPPSDDPNDPAPDSWAITPCPDQEGKNPYEDTLAEFWSGNYDGEANAIFSATFNPQTVLRLIELAEKADELEDQLLDCKEHANYLQDQVSDG